MTDSVQSQSYEKTHAAMAACITSARHLLESAKAVFAVGKSNIAYHLAAAALEELGKREIFAVEATSASQPVPPAWPRKHAQDHVHKLFWCFFGPSFYETLTKQALEEMQQVAKIVHEKRLQGLYVESTEWGILEPHTAIAKEDAENLIDLAAARLTMTEAQKPRTPTAEEAVEQEWFLRAAADPHTRNYVMSSASMTKLAELKSGLAWIKWLREQFTLAEAASLEALEAENQRSQNLPEEKTRDKWRVRIRLFSASHSIRPATLTKWNEHSESIKLVAVNGKKNQLLLELTLGDNVPLGGLWYFAWGLARHFVTALNIGTMGFWWWRLPEQVSRYYESIEDLENHSEIGLERSPSLKIDWGENRVFDEADIARTAMAFAAIPSPGQRDQHGAFNHYIGGITFLSLNDVHWQCEAESFGNFYESLKAMMKDAGDWDGESPFETPMLEFLSAMFSDFDEKDRFAELCRQFDTKAVKRDAVTLQEVSFIKLFCDAYFLRRVQPERLRAIDLSRQTEAAGSDTPIAHRSTLRQELGTNK